MKAEIDRILLFLSWDCTEFECQFESVNTIDSDIAIHTCMSYSLVLTLERTCEDFFSKLDWGS